MDGQYIPHADPADLQPHETAGSLISSVDGSQPS
jgi:hypothetical protein